MFIEALTIISIKFCCHVRIIIILMSMIININIIKYLLILLNIVNSVNIINIINNVNFINIFIDSIYIINVIIT